MGVAYKQVLSNTYCLHCRPHSSSQLSCMLLWHLVGNITNVGRKWRYKPKVHHGRWGLRTRLQNAETCSSVQPYQPPPSSSRPCVEVAPSRANSYVSYLVASHDVAENRTLCCPSLSVTVIVVAFCMVEGKHLGRFAAVIQVPAMVVEKKGQVATHVYTK